MPNEAEALVILNHHVAGLLNRVHNLKKVFGSERSPEFMRDPQLKKIAAALVKSFPESPAGLENLSGYELIERNASQYATELEEYYFIFFECLQFKEKSYKILADMSTSARSLTMDVNPAETKLYLSLLVNYAKLHLLLSSIPERKLIIAFYAKAYFRMTLRAEEQYTSITNYIQAFEDARDRLISEFASVSSLVGNALSSLQMSYMKLLNPDQMRNDGTINPTTSSLAIESPAHSQFLYDALHCEEYTMWILYGTLLCPNELSSANLYGMLQMALKHVSIMPIYRDEVLVMHNEFQAVFATFNGPSINLTKQKKFVGETASSFVEEAGPVHATRRTWLRQEMGQMFALFSACPELIAPKLSQLLAACSMAREEIYWLFLHNNQPSLPPLKSKAKLKSSDFEDPRVAELVHYVYALNRLVVAHSATVRQYYLTYLKTTDLEAFQATLNDFSADCGLDEQPLAVFEDIINNMRTCTLDNRDYFEIIRLSWTRLQTVYCSVQSPFAESNMSWRKLAQRMNIICTHAEYAGYLDDVLLRYTSLSQAFWFKDKFLEAFKIAVGAAHVLGHCAQSFAGVCNMFVDDTNEYLPEERVYIGAESINVAKTIVNTISEQVANCCTRYGEGILSLKAQIAPVKAANSVQAMIDGAEGAGAASGAAAASAASAEPGAAAAAGSAEGDAVAAGPEALEDGQPGSESAWKSKNRSSLSQMHSYLIGVRNLCSSFMSTDAVVVFDYKLCPRETLAKTVMQKFTDIVLHLCRLQDQLIARPSVLLERVTAYVHAYMLIETFVDVDIQSVLRAALVTHTFSVSLEKTKQGQEDDGSNAKVLVDYVAHFYAQFMLQRVVDGVMYSPLNGSFITQVVPGRIAPVGPPAQNYLSEYELRALVTLLGPTGADALDHYLVNAIARCVNSIKKLITGNQAVAEELVANYHAEEPASVTLQRFTQLPLLISAVTTIGNITFLREMLRKALSEAVDTSLPFISAVVKTTFSLYPPNYQRRAELIPTDLMAKNCGLPASADLLLLGVCLTVCNSQPDVQLWARLPFHLAACLSCSAHFNTPAAHFDAALEGSMLGTHAFATAAALLVGAFGLTLESLREGPAEKPTKTAVVHSRLFVEVASVVAMRMVALQGKMQHRELPSLFIVIDKFVQASPFVSIETLDANLPYPLLLSAYRSLYDSNAAASASPARPLQLTPDTPLDDPNFF